MGGLAAYLYDPELGAERRAQMSSLLRARAQQVGRIATPMVEAARPAAVRMTDAVSRVDWKRPIEKVHPVATLRKMLGGAAVGAAFVYFLDPVKGSMRRQSALEAGRRAVREVSAVITPVPGIVRDRLADSVETLKSKAS